MTSDDDLVDGLLDRKRERRTHIRFDLIKLNRISRGGDKNLLTDHWKLIGKSVDILLTAHEGSQIDSKYFWFLFY